jgi:hypothetical protein
METDTIPKQLRKHRLYLHPQLEVVCH